MSINIYYIIHVKYIHNINFSNGGSKDDLNKHINIDIIHKYKTIANQILSVTKSINMDKIIFVANTYT